MLCNDIFTVNCSGAILLFYRQILARVESPVMFCHNDMQEGIFRLGDSLVSYSFPAAFDKYSIQNKPRLHKKNRDDFLVSLVMKKKHVVPF